MVVYPTRPDRDRRGTMSARGVAVLLDVGVEAAVAGRPIPNRQIRTIVVVDLMAERVGDRQGRDRQNRQPAAVLEMWTHDSADDAGVRRRSCVE